MRAYPYSEHFPAPEFKTKRISKTEWRKNFTPTERVRSDWVEDNINGDLSSLGGTNVDLPATILLGSDTKITYRSLLRTAYKSFALADWININDAETQLAIQVMAVTGVLDSQARASILLQGIPLTQESES